MQSAAPFPAGLRMTELSLGRPALLHCFFDRFIPGLFFKFWIVRLLTSLVFRLCDCWFLSERPLRESKSPLMAFAGDGDDPLGGPVNFVLHRSSPGVIGIQSAIASSRFSTVANSGLSPLDMAALPSSLASDILSSTTGRAIESA